MHFLGLHKEDHILQVALLEQEKKNTSIKLLRSFVIKDNEEYVKPLYILSSLIAKKNFSISSALRAEEILFRKVSVKLTSLPSIKKIIPFQFEENHPYPFSEAIALPFIDKKKKKEGAILSFFSTRSQNLQKHLLELDEFSIEPEFVSCEPQALYRFSKFFFPIEESLFVFHLGYEKSCWVSIAEGNIEISHSLDFGISHVFSALKDDFPEKSIEELELLLHEKKDLHFLENPLFSETAKSFANLQRQLLRIHLFCEQKQGENAPKKILITGAFSTTTCLDLIYKKSCPNLTFLLIDSSKEVFSSSDLHSYAIAIGTALDTLSQDRKTLQFRQKAFVPQKQIKRKKQLLLCYILGIILFCLSANFAGKMIIKNRVGALLQSHENLLVSKSQKIPYESIDKQLQEIESKERELSTTKSSLPLFPSTPQVSEVLLWLSTHKNLNAKPSDAIKIDKFRYFLTSYPKLGKKPEPYIGKVELQFSAASSRHAKAFHEALLSDKEYVDTKKEIVWNQSKDQYTVSFFLLPKRK
ncbi:MAG: hypothetical protein HKM07_00050 [Chlamydiae bacterium]|nr:hypothetical protein [Chlamydiota bacterium]